MNNYLKLLIDRKFRFSIFASRGIYNRLSDEKFLKKAYKIKFGKTLNLNNPQTFNEKLQWLKLNDRNPLYTTLVDKYAVKKYIADKIGEEYIIPTLGVWDSFDDIDFASLPEQFVLKCTHNSGGLIICKDKKKLDVDSARMKITKYLNRNYYWLSREWPYKNVKPRIIVEKYMVDDSGYELKDYKFYCFDGQVKLLMIASDRLTGKQKHFDYYDRHGQVQNIVWGGVPNSPIPQPLPEQYEEMVNIAEKLSEGIPHVRIDLYLISGKIHFGEMTFFDASGFDDIQPEEWNEKLGSWITLPEKRC